MLPGCSKNLTGDISQLSYRMKNKGLSLPDVNNSEYGYGLAYKLACEQLAKVDNIEQQCLKSGAKYQAIDSKKVIIVEYLGRSYIITLPDIEISLKDIEETVPLRDKILILHYLVQARGTPLASKVIAYKELPEGAHYFPTFAKRAIKPIIDHFGQEPQKLLDTAAKLGGRRTDYGDIAVTINAFHQIPITIVLWQGDKELPPECNIIFDASISDYLSTEDINVLCEIIAWRLVKLQRAGGDTHSSS